MIIFLYGDDTFRSRRKLKELKDKFIREVDSSAMNIEVLDGSKLETADFEKAINTLPFLAKKRLVVVEELLSKNRSQKVPLAVGEILARKDSPEVIIIFWESQGFGGKDKKNKGKSAKTGGPLFINLAKEKYAYEFGMLDDAGVYNWAGKEIRDRGGKIQPAALRLLTEMVGNDLWRLNSEIDKLLAFAKQTEIAPDNVLRLIQSKLEDDIFKLTDALGSRNKALALKLIADQLKSGTSPTELLSKFTWQFKNLLLIKDFVEKNGSGYNPTRLGYQLGLHPFVIKKTINQVGHYAAADLKRIYRQLLGIDFKIKTSQANPEVLFDLLVAKS
jgi:DNA polymerase-3 subunit delta